MNSTRPVISLLTSTRRLTFDGATFGGYLTTSVTGAGMSPITVTTRPRNRGGSRRGTRRKTEGVIQVMLHVGSTPDTYVDKLLADLAALVDTGDLRLEVYDPIGGTRHTKNVEYRAGLEGDWTRGARGTDWEIITLELLALDPYWSGETRHVAWALDEWQKPFIGGDLAFFPVVLSSSAIAGRQTFEVSGDAPAYPIIRVTPPGSDLVITHQPSGRRIEVSGQIGNGFTIDTRPEVRDLWDDQNPDGQLWERISRDSIGFFELHPGTNTITVDMLGTNLESAVRIEYDEQFRMSKRGGS